MIFSAKEHYSTAKFHRRALSRQRPSTVHARGAHDIPMVNVNDVSLFGPTCSNVEQQLRARRESTTNEREKMMST
ncbi:hypothetical protein RB195_020301 [Necator americanus]|uniref:Uncharacterized protein n=1 Tax=Necator americanus TaxID=51031 RepID=A0ABR1CI69_NECAM